MEKVLKILLLEDSPADVELIAYELRVNGISASWLLADNEQRFVELLDQDIDLILADYSLPQFNAEDALEHLRRRDLDIPFILVSGTVGEEKAVSLIKAGATDYILKHSLARLPSSVRRAMQEREARQRQRLLHGIFETLALQPPGAETVHAILTQVRGHTHFDAVGISLGAGGDFSFHDAACVGQNALGDNRFCGHEGRPEWQQCFCHQVLRGGASRQLPWFTPSGSFWCDNLAELPGSLTLGQYQGLDSLRSHCLGQGYQACALIPMRAEGQVLGVLQLGAVRPGVINARTITFLEGVAATLALAFVHQRVRERLAQNEEKLHYLASYDTLSGLPNRELLKDRLQHAMAKARLCGHKVALLALGLDRFKHINDSFGHVQGDELLRQVSQALLAMVRDTDTVARLSGDEFLICLEDVADVNQVAMVVRHLLTQLSKTPLRLGAEQLFMSASIGAALFPEDGETVESLIRNADSAMFRAKEAGRGSYRFFTADMNAHARELLMLESALRQALEKDELLLYFQPQLDLAEGRLVGMEALLRWQWGERLVRPDEFIPVAEETGLILAMGDWVLRAACRQARAWQRAGHPPVIMAVNVSARQMHQADLVATVARTLNETGLSPHLLELELTESLLMKNVDQGIRIMKDLAAMGVRLAIDDFGTGYSSLSYLKRFPIQRLKIDRSFVMDVTTDAAAAEIAASVIALGHSMNLEVIAEGVESQAQQRFLLERGCRLGQGYLYSPPRPAEEIQAFFNLPQKPVSAEFI